ncbi:MAG: hypothetical protein Q9187_009098, partial [Circinaria calcarea]
MDANDRSRYVLHHNSGPFLREVDAHYNIAFSCISYLLTSFCLVDSSLPDDEIRLQIVKGYHGLHNYADEFWSEHLLQYINLVDNFDYTTSLSLIKQLEKLLPFQKLSRSQEFCSELDGMKTLLTVSSRLSGLSSLPKVKIFLYEVLAFREILAHEKHRQKEPEAFVTYEVENDPTIFSDIRQRYQNIVEYLLDCARCMTPDGIDQNLLDRFVETYGNSAFVCRYRGCPRALDGF